jgi:hypothetical protein
MNLELFGFGKKKPAIAEDTPLSFLEKQTQVAKEELIRANKDAITFSQSPANRAKLQEFRPGENFSVSNQQARFTDDPEAIRLYESYKLDNDPTLSIDDYLGGIRGKYGARNYGDLNDVALINKNVSNTRNVPSKTVYTDAMHESTHSRSIRLGATDAESKIASDAWSPMIKQNDFGMPNEEAFAVQNELRTTKLKDLQGNRIYTDKDIPEIKKGLQEMINEGHDYLQGVNVKDFDMSAFIKSLNKIGIGAVAPVSAIGVSQLDKKQNGGEMKFYQEELDWKPKSMQDGGIVEDDMGYWNPDNRGKPVRINSNMITMEGVNEPLLGIDDTGDTKLMLPGENYKFKGEKVTEYPIAQDGIKTPYEPVNSTIADIFRTIVPAPKNFSQMLAKEVLKDARMSNKSLSDNEKVILWNTIQNARERTGKDSGGTAYQDYGNQGWGTPEEFHQRINRGKSSITDLISNSITNPAFNLATTIGRGVYKVDPNNPDVIHYTDNYDWNSKEKNFSGENEYQKLRNYVRDNEDKDVDKRMFDMNFTLTKDDIDKIKQKQDWINTGPQFGRYAGMPVFNDKKKNGGSLGINQLDAQPKKKLNQLLNFTNNPDKNWLNKYQ